MFTNEGSNPHQNRSRTVQQRTSAVYIRTMWRSRNIIFPVESWFRPSLCPLSGNLSGFDPRKAGSVWNGRCRGKGDVSGEWYTLKCVCRRTQERGNFTLVIPGCSICVKMIFNGLICDKTDIKLICNNEEAKKKS